MKKIYKQISIIVLTLSLVFGVFGFRETLHAQALPTSPGEFILSTAISAAICAGQAQGSIFLCALNKFFTTVVSTGLQFVSLITSLGGVVLNGVLYYTVVQVADSYSKIPGINEAWKVVRDLSNMAFIFLLLYAAIKTILGTGGENQKLIMRIIVVAILINFSLYFTKFVIDVSNVLALFLYDAIAPGAAQAGFIGYGSSGLSNSFMQYLNLTSLYKDVGAGLDFGQIITVGLMGSILLLIAAFVFFAVAIMFVIRYVVLIFTLILSPLAFLGFILPQAKKYIDMWWNALSGQAFFAPIYFLLTFITLRVLGGVMTSLGANPNDPTAALSSIALKNISASSFAMFLNFFIVITFLIISLMVAKEWANKAPGGVNKLTSWATGFAGGATLGLAGRAGRNSVGAGASRLSQSEGFQQWAGRSIVGQYALNQTNKLARSSFDLRATKVGDATVGILGAGQAEKGGYEANLKKKTEKREKFAQSLRSPQARETFATRISRGPLTLGGTRSRPNSVFGVLGRHNRVAASKLLHSQLGPLETQEQNLQNRENQLTQQLSGMNNELATINAAVAAGAATAQQIARQGVLNGPVGDRRSIAYIQDQLTTTQARLTNVTNEATRIRAVITNNQLTNPATQIVNPVTGTSRDIRADEQNF